MSYFVYILYSPSSDKYYTGSTSDCEIRLAQHNAGRNKSTNHEIPWKLAYLESYPNRAEALRREL